MKKLFTLILLSCIALGSTVAQIKWTSIENSDKINNEKLYIIDFYTSWCGWCKQMDKTTFTDPTVIKIINKYYTAIKFNAEGTSEFTWKGTKYTGGNSNNGRPATHAFTKATLGQKIGFPSFAIFNSDKSLINVVQGYNKPKDFIVILWYFASKDYLKYSFDQYENIFDEEIKPVMEKELAKGAVETHKKQN